VRGSAHAGHAKVFVGFSRDEAPWSELRRGTGWDRSELGKTRRDRYRRRGGADSAPFPAPEQDAVTQIPPGWRRPVWDAERHGAEVDGTAAHVAPGHHERRRSLSLTRRRLLATLTQR
jgi:hypothetical protein